MENLEPARDLLGELDDLVVIKLLSKHFGKQVYIRRGFKSGRKLIDVNPNRNVY